VFLDGVAGIFIPQNLRALGGRDPLLAIYDKDVQVAELAVAEYLNVWHGDAPFVFGWVTFRYPPDFVGVSVLDAP
jgi:hypothetical protein